MYYTPLAVSRASSKEVASLTMLKSGHTAFRLASSLGYKRFVYSTVLLASSVMLVAYLAKSS